MFHESISEKIKNDKNKSLGIVLPPAEVDRLKMANTGFSNNKVCVFENDKKTDFLIIQSFPFLY